MSRGNNEGSIYQRKDGRWVAAVSIPDSGLRPKRKTFYGPTRADVAGKLSKAMRQLQQGMPAGDDRITVEQFLTQWLRDSVQPTVKESTFGTYEKDVRLHMIPALGKLRLAKLLPHHIQALYRAKLESLAPSSVLHVHRVMMKALSQAERWGLVQRNVARLVDAPRVGKSEVKAMDIDEAKAFLAAVEGDHLQALYLAALTLGLRRGELLALRWDDIDFNAGTIAVRRSLMKVKGERGVRSGWQFSEPKSNSSRRVVRMPEFVTTAFRAHRVKTAERRLAAAVWENPSLVFASEVGTILDARNVLREFKLVLGRAQLSDSFTIHSLRHSAATLMLALDVQPKVVMETLGHSRIGVTMDVYTHVLPHLQEQAAAKMDRLLAGP